MSLKRNKTSSQQNSALPVTKSVGPTELDTTFNVIIYYKNTQQKKKT